MIGKDGEELQLLNHMIWRFRPAEGWMKVISRAEPLFFRDLAECIGQDRAKMSESTAGATIIDVLAVAKEQGWDGVK